MAKPKAVIFMGYIEPEAQGGKVYEKSKPEYVPFYFMSTTLNSNYDGLNERFTTFISMYPERALGERKDLMSLAADMQGIANNLNAGKLNDKEAREILHSWQKSSRKPSRKLANVI